MTESVICDCVKWSHSNIMLFSICVRYDSFTMTMCTTIQKPCIYRYVPLGCRSNKSHTPMFQLSGSTQTFTCNSTPNSCSQGWLIDETIDRRDDFVSMVTHQTVSSCEHSSTKWRDAFVGAVLYKFWNIVKKTAMNTYCK